MKLKKYNDFALNESEDNEEEPRAVFLEGELLKIEGIDDKESLDEYVNFLTCHHHFPLNPIDPIRSALREKIYELKETENNINSMYLHNLEGEWKAIVLPPGAVY
jgi:hypothetical protein